jgi:hypothetical protein
MFIPRRRTWWRSVDGSWIADRPFGHRRYALITRVIGTLIEFELLDGQYPANFSGQLCRVEARDCDFQPQTVYTPFNYPYLWDTPVLDKEMPDLALPAAIVRALSGVGWGLKTLRDVVRLRVEDVLDIPGMGPSRLQTLADFMAGHNLHFSAYDLDMIPPPGQRWLKFRPHPVLLCEAPDYLVTWLARDPAEHPDDEDRLAELIQSQMAFTIRDLTGLSAGYLAAHHWQSGGEAIDLPLLSPDESLRWLQDVLAAHDLELAA